jgi:hypothetical protein
MRSIAVVTFVGHAQAPLGGKVAAITRARSTDGRFAGLGVATAAKQ